MAAASPRPNVARSQERELHGHGFHLEPARAFNLTRTSQSCTSDDDLVEHNSGDDHLVVKPLEQFEVTSPGEVDERPGIGHDDHEWPSWLSSCSRSAAG